MVSPFVAASAESRRGSTLLRQQLSKQTCCFCHAVCAAMVEPALGVSDVETKYRADKNVVRTEAFSCSFPFPISHVNSAA